MEPKDQPSDDNPGFSSSKRASLHLDASKFQLAPYQDDEKDDDGILSPQGTPTPSTGSSSMAFTASATQGRPRAMTQGASSLPGPSVAHVRNRSATVANPPKSMPPGSTAPEREKRKRSRVTPEQLTHLERLFAADRSPTAAKRKEISEMLGMQERQTQIWFQNRRAKAKTLEGKGKMGFRGSPTSGGDSPPDTPPDFSAALEVDLQNLIHEDEPVLFIPCSDLSIGSWRRISATLGQHDLVAYVSTAKRCLTWFIYSNGFGFKMEIPFESIMRTTFTNASPGQGLASFYLSRPPLFYLESVSSPGAGLGPTKVWKKCPDWTEGQQASMVLRHDLIGAAGPLVSALKSLPVPEHMSGLVPGASLGPAPYHPSDAMPMHIPQPPLVGLESQAPFPLSAGSHSHLIHGRKRSFSGPPALSQTSQDLSDFTLLGPQAGPSETQSTLYSAPFPERPNAFTFGQEYSTPLYRPFSTTQAHPTGSHHPHSSLTDFSNVPISHAAAPRPYSASSVDTRFPFDSQTSSSILHGSSDQYSSGEATSNQYGSSMRSSPPLLTSAFDPSSLHHDVQMTSSDSASLEMNPSRFGGSSEDVGTQHEQYQTMGLTSSQHDQLREAGHSS